MKRAWIFQIIVICFVFPAVIFSLLIPDKSQSPTEQTIPTIEETGDEAYKISLLHSDGNIERIPLNTYILRVVLREMPASFEVEALKAQAVVARTYTLRRLETGSKHVGAAVCTEPSCCQGYCDEGEYLESGGTEALLTKVKSAVDSTENYVLTYNGALIEATYFSCSGGMTEDAVSVWGSDIPYLRAKESPGEESATHFTDTATFDRRDFLQALGIDTSTSLVQIGQIHYTQGGGVDSISICGQEFTGTELRRILGLRSTAFMISVVGERVIITTKGFGHRVGMSQYGADAMAVNGNDFREILAYYYTDTELTVYNPTD